MNTTRLEISPLKGLDESLPPSSNSCILLENFTVNKKTSAWDNRLGYEKYFSSDDKYGPFNSDTSTTALYVWNTKGGAVQHVLYETADVTLGIQRLKVLTHNPDGAAVLEAGRTKTAINETGTRFNPYGRYLVITNGYDGPWRFDGQRLLPLGYMTAPGAPTPWHPDAEYDGNATWQFYPIVEQGDRPLHVIYGLGQKTADAWNIYKYKIAFEDESGAMSPLSSPSEPVAWQTAAVSTPNPEAWDVKRQAVHLEGIPLGPTGTVARLVYRTLNLKDSDTEDDSYYYVGKIYNNVETNYTDFVSDSAVGALAPSNIINFPAPSCRMSATFASSLFIDGGLSEPTRIYYSDPSTISQFSALNFFDVGSRDGGIITAMVPYQNNLIVFRERAIDLIRRDEQSGEFYLKPLQEGIGTTAAQTISIIPRLGLAFLAEDGVWVIKPDFSMANISGNIIETIDRMNVDVMPKASAAYSKYWNEWHCYFAVDGSSKNNMGIVFHFDKLEWSKRPDWPVSVIDTDAQGNFIFGHNTGKSGILASENYEAGLFVISGVRNYGYTIVEEQQEYVTQPSAPDNCKLQTVWNDFGNPNLAKHVKHVYLYVLTTGDNDIPITYRKDYSFETSTAAPSKKMQRAERAVQVVFDNAIFDTDTWQKPMLTEIRYDISQGTCRHFSFEVETNDDFIIEGYAIELTADNTKMRPGRGA